MIPRFTVYYAVASPVCLFCVKSEGGIKIDGVVIHYF